MIVCHANVWYINILPAATSPVEGIIYESVLHPGVPERTRYRGFVMGVELPGSYGCDSTCLTGDRRYLLRDHLQVFNCPRIENLQYK